MMKPDKDSKPQGTKITFTGDVLTIGVWRGYSPDTEQYYGTTVTFLIVRERKEILLRHIFVKSPFVDWVPVSNADVYITDHMERAVRKAVAERTGLTHWRIVK